MLCVIQIAGPAVYLSLVLYRWLALQCTFPLFYTDGWPCSVPFPCVVNERYGDSEDCAYYYECLHGEPVHQPCETTLNFDILTKQCDWPENVTCQSLCSTQEPFTGTVPVPG